jgi:STE24 endopeptidase
MYFVVIMAFALVLTSGLPPEQLNLCRAWPTSGPIGVVAAEILLVVVSSLAFRRRVLGRLDGTDRGHEDAVDTLTRAHQVLLGVITLGLVAMMLFTPWASQIRAAWRPSRIPLLPDLLILSPFFGSIALAWTLLYPVELRIRKESLRLEASGAPRSDGASESTLIVGPQASLASYLFDKFRHQVFIVAVPMGIIVVAKFLIDQFKYDLIRLTRLNWIADSLLGITSVAVLFMSPVLLRFIWSTVPLPDGPLRNRFVQTCRRIGLRYREILLWRTHGLAVNAAVMGFVPRLRYILVSDALLQTMNDDEIEAVFGHEAGHVRHWHLHFFALFGLLSTFVASIAFLLFGFTYKLNDPHYIRSLLAGVVPYNPAQDPVGLVYDPAILGLIVLAALLACWLFGFGWLSRKFERQADLYGIRCITPDIRNCTDRCPVHGAGEQENRRTGEGERSPAHLLACSPALCVSAAQLFGRTLLKIADLNGIPRHAPSWRHGSIDSRCELIERLATDPQELRRFDRTLWALKAGLVLLSLVGTIIAAWIYYPSIAAALGWQVGQTM